MTKKNKDMKNAIILNLPYKNKKYDSVELEKFKNWVKFFTKQEKDIQIIITTPFERKDDSLDQIIYGISNASIIPSASFDTCDRWRIGFLEASKDEDIEFFYLWSADFEFSELAKSSAIELFEHTSNKDLVVGTIQATGTKELIDSVGTFPLLELWFKKECKYLEREGFSKPRSELFRISRSLLKESLEKRWYPSEQTLHLLLICIWGGMQFSLEPLPLKALKDDDQLRDNPGAFQQIERMELWLKYIWKDRHAKWLPNEYYTLCDKSGEILRNAFDILVFRFKNGHPVSDANYRLVVQDSWKDIHHSRNQDWTALGAILAAQFGVFKIIETFSEKGERLIDQPKIYLVACLAGIVLSYAGLCVTRRHKSLSKIKLDWITEAENRLGVLKSTRNPMGIIEKQDYGGISVNRLIISVYQVLIAINIVIGICLIFKF
ncbi:MAG: hypothetical protein QNK40_06480 [Desulfobacterales bacterium]|nr:hypothetical protein [Desulfobacterales bacterium]